MLTEPLKAASAAGTKYEEMRLHAISEHIDQNSCRLGEKIGPD
jgi:hypothetical protein